MKKPFHIGPPRACSKNVVAWMEIYYIDYLDDGTFSAPRRVTANTYTDIFPTLSPDGKGMV